MLLAESRTARFQTLLNNLIVTGLQRTHEISIREMIIEMVGLRCAARHSQLLSEILNELRPLVDYLAHSQSKSLESTFHTLSTAERQESKTLHLCGLAICAK